ncbi:fimbrial protein [Candidatus Burkholderia verschuerenii]|uniref:fimbrial protein n=1 Tax=Candidatus Burkholderia verschuerenii TaxID=242163 RepID=UPI0009F950D7|nr:fimbrial protein [Candidatus Burkholderia verschuerenii]
MTPGRDTTVGTVLQSVPQNPGMTASITCTVQQASTVNGTLVPGNPKTYQTNVPGIGVRFYVTSGYSGGFEQAPITSSFSNSGSTAHYTQANLVVTGPVGTGTLTDLPSMTITYTGSCITTTSTTQYLTAGSAITGTTCSIDNSNVQVKLPTVAPSAMPSAGSTAGDTAFTLNLTCSVAAKVYVTLTDAVNTGNRSTTLSLDPNSVAAGVGIQVLFNSTPVAYGADTSVAGNQNQWLAGSASAGPMSIPLVARYVRTSSSKITMGRLTGKATFTMSYQ